MFRRMAVLVALVATVAGACGGDDGDGGVDATSGGDESATAATSESTPVSSGSATGSSATPSSSGGGAATGDPVVLGFINQEEGSAGTFPDQRVGAEAAVELINEQGGVNGRPLELLTCTTDGSPEASQACANQMVQSNVALVQAGTDFGDVAAIPILAAAGIVYVPTLPYQAEHFASEGVFTFFGGAIAQTSAEVRTVMDHGAQNVGMLVMNVPAAIAAADNLIKAPLEAEGVTVSIVPFDANTSDFTPSLTALMQQDPDEIIVFTSGPPCGQVMQAAGALGVDVPMQYPSDCLTKEHLAAGGAGADGALFMMETLVPSVHPDDPDVQLYVDAMQRFADLSVDELTNSHQVAFIATYNLGQLLARVDGDITGESVEQAFSASVDVPSLMAQPYSCDGSALPGFSSICNAGVRVVQREGGELVEATGDWLTPATG